MTIPKYEFCLKDAAQPGEPKRFCDALIATGRFWRDEHSVVKFELAPGDFVVIAGKGMMRELLLSGEFMQVIGDFDLDTLWSYFISRRWTFPRLNPERPWNPPKPLPVRGTPYVAPSLGRKVQS